MDGIVVTLTLGLAVLIGVGLVLVPLASLATTDLHATLRREGRSGTTSRKTQTFRNVLVVAQISIVFVLLIGATLLLASFQRILAIDTGFRTGHVMTASVSLPSAHYPDARLAFAGRALEQIRGLPGVVSALNYERALTACLPAVPIGRKASVKSPVTTMVRPADLAIASGEADAVTAAGPSSAARRCCAGVRPAGVWRSVSENIPGRGSRAVPACRRPGPALDAPSRPWRRYRVGSR